MLARDTASAVVRAEPEPERTLAPADGLGMLERARALPIEEPYHLRVVDAVCGALAVTGRELLAHDRHLHLAVGRQIAMLLLRQRGWSWPCIGHILKRDHTTVMAGVRRLEDKLARYDVFATSLLSAVLQRLYGAV